MLLAVLVLSLGTAVAAAAGFNVTVMPWSGVGAAGSIYLPIGLAPWSTEVGLPVGDRLELVAGLDYHHDYEEGYGDGSLSLLNVGARYFLTDDEDLRPFVFGNYGGLIFGGDYDDGDSMRLVKVGLGAVAPIGGRWGVVAQTGLNWATWEDDEDGTEIETVTFSAIGVRYNF